MARMHKVMEIARQAGLLLEHFRCFVMFPQNLGCEIATRELRIRLHRGDDRCQVSGEVLAGRQARRLDCLDI